MKIALLGYGKMGHQIELISQKLGYKIEIKTSSSNPTNKTNLSAVDVAIDFSTPKTAFDNITHAIKSKVPVISGTTGWDNNKGVIKDLCEKYQTAFMHSSNFSIGVNIFLKLNETLAKLMEDQDYTNMIYETHHIDKIDSPSGTSIKIRKDIQKINNQNPIIKSKRVRDVIGEHTIVYDSKIDTVSINHSAKNREGFAFGALLAAKWIINKKGVFTFNDVIQK